jgi:hypothetical protein
MIETLVVQVAAGVAVAAILALSGWTAKTVGGERRHRKISGEALRALLYDRIKTICEDCISQGVLDIEGKRNLQVLYKAYDDLDGNGFISHLYTKAMELPMTREPPCEW